MSKPIIHVGVGVIGSHVNPGKGTVLAIGASAAGRNFQRFFKGSLETLPFPWSKSTEIKALLEGATVSVEEGVEEFYEWLKALRSNVVGIVGEQDDWRILKAMMEVVGKCPLGNKMIDVDTWIMAQLGVKKFREAEKWRREFRRADRKEGWEGILPVEIAKDRLWAVTLGAREKVGLRNKKRELDWTVNDPGVPVPTPPPTPQFRWANYYATALQNNVVQNNAAAANIGTLATELIARRDANTGERF